MSRGDNDDDGLLSRWSRRKRATLQEDGPERPTDTETGRAVAPDAADPAEPSEPDPAETETEQETLARLGLPDPDTLKAGDDFSGFMQKSVPEYLRRRALRVLWRSNPVLANLDGLNDYDEDFTSAEETGKILHSAYKIGRGFLPDPDEETETPAETAPDASPDAPEDNEPPGTIADGGEKTDDSAREIESATNEAAEEVREMPQAVVAETPEKREQPSEVRPRRMRFKT